MKYQKSHNLCSFVASFWLEREQPGIPIWRGHIRHVQSEQQVSFQDLKEMCNFVEQVSGVSGPEDYSAIEVMFAPRQKK